MTIKDILKADTVSKARILDNDSKDIDMTAVWVVLNLSDRKT